MNSALRFSGYVLDYQERRGSRFKPRPGQKFGSIFSIRYASLLFSGALLFITVQITICYDGSFHSSKTETHATASNAVTSAHLSSIPIRYTAYFFRNEIR